jgi:hypothetical protein
MNISMVAISLAALLACVQQGHGQRIPTGPTPNLSTDAPCPPRFPSFYTDDGFGTFWGVSRLTMAQQDQYHTYQFFTYEFYGRTRDGKTSVRGTHHVNAAQCTQAAWHYWMSVPAIIGTLHNAQFATVACGSGPEKTGPGEVLASVAGDCGDPGGGGARAREGRP